MADPADLQGLRCALVIGGLVAGGAERFVCGLARELRGRGIEVTLLAISCRQDAVGDEMAEQLREAGVRVFSGPTERIRLRSVLWYLGAMRRLRPELVHLHNLNSESAHFLAHRFLGFRYAGIRTIHSTRLALDALSRGGFSRNPIAATVFCSEVSRQQNQALFRGLQVTIPNGIHFDWPLRGPETALAAKRKLGLDPDRLHFLCLGRMTGTSLAEAPKNHDTLLRAWAAAAPGRGDALLHLVGDGNLRPELELLAGADPSSLFHGVRADVRDWLLAADCFVMPSRWEGHPIAAIEALGTGLHCIFADIPPLRYLEPPSASWCDPEDEASLARAIVAFTRAPGYASESAVRLVRERFAIAATAEAYLGVYARVTEGRA